MNPTDKWVKEVAAYGVFGGLAGVPTAMAEYPWIYAAMVLPLIVSYVQIRNLARSGLGFLQTWIYCPGPYIGAGCAFHLVHGEWDYQGVAMAIVGWVAAVPILYALERENAHNTGRPREDPQQADREDGTMRVSDR